MFSSSSLRFSLISFWTSATASFAALSNSWITTSISTIPTNGLVFWIRLNQPQLRSFKNWRKFRWMTLINSLNNLQKKLGINIKFVFNKLLVFSKKLQFHKISSNLFLWHMPRLTFATFDKTRRFKCQRKNIKFFPICHHCKENKFNEPHFVTYNYNQINSNFISSYTFWFIRWIDIIKQIFYFIQLYLPLFLPAFKLFSTHVAMASPLKKSYQFDDNIITKLFQVTQAALHDIEII